MNLKEFFKPNTKKLKLLFILPFLLFTIFSASFWILKISQNQNVPTDLIGLALVIFGQGINWVIPLAVWYFLSCLIIWIYDSLKKKKR